MKLFDQITLLLTGLVAIYVIWQFYSRYSQKKALYDVYYLLGFVVLLVSGVLLIFLGYGILGLGGTSLSPYILPVASLIPLGISIGVAEQYYPQWKKAFKWFALLGFLAIAVTSIGGIASVRKIAVPLFHGVAGFVIFLGPIFAEKSGKAPQGFFWAGIGGALIGVGGLALASLTIAGAPLFGIFTKELVFTILAPLLLLMTLAFAWGFVKDIKTS
jgi:hypothetical protein